MVGGFEMAYKIEEMKHGHISKVVEVHLAGFLGFFLTFLGPSFLRELYSSLIEDPYGVCLVALEADEVVGFAAGTSRSSGIYSRLMRQRLIRFALAVLPAVLKKPTIIPRLLRGVTDPQSQPASDEKRGRLMSIAVDPQQQGKGIGKLLVSEFLELASQRGARQVDLTTDKVDNQPTNLFYQRLGFIIERSYTTPEGREMNQYLIDLE